MLPYLQAPITNGGTLTTTTAFQDIPNLTFTLVPAATYRFEVHYDYQASGTTAQFAPAMGGTCTTSFLKYRCSIEVNLSGGSSSFVYNALSGAITPGGATAANAATTNYGVMLSGLIVVNAGGTLTASARHVTAACTVQSGGRFILEQIA